MNALKKLLILVVISEGATGTALLLVPSLVGQLLFGTELTGIAVIVARMTGIALICLSIACWPGPPLLGMLLYSAAVALYLASIGFAGSLTGILLWPAFVLHILMTLLLIWALASDRKMKKTKE